MSIYEKYSRLIVVQILLADGYSDKNCENLSQEHVN